MRLSILLQPGLLPLFVLFLAFYRSRVLSNKVMLASPSRRL